MSLGDEMYDLASKLFPICRSITGDGVRETLQIIGKEVPLRIHEVPTGTKAFDWTVPKEWNIKDAWIKDSHGRKIVDFGKNNLHVVGYSIPVDKWVTLSELKKHLYSLEEQPDAIPYITSYYKEHWGFCVTHNFLKTLKGGKYHVFIDSLLEDGSLTYGECFIPGESKKEVFFSTYVCHPSMANNEISGPTVSAFLAKWIREERRRLSYRFVFIPETIGSLTYMSRNLDGMKRNIISGFNISCVGDERGYSYIESRVGNTLADKVIRHVLTSRHPGFTTHSYLTRGSDERQYCSPGIDLPLVCVCRSKFNTYPEYHTSLDDLSLITPGGLEGSYHVLQDCVLALEENRIYRNRCLDEPQLGRRGLYPSVGTKHTKEKVKDMMNFLAYADGSRDLIDIADIIRAPVWELYSIVKTLESAGLIEPDHNPL